MCACSYSSAGLCFFFSTSLWLRLEQLNIVIYANALERARCAYLSCFALWIFAKTTTTNIKPSFSMMTADVSEFSAFFHWNWQFFFLLSSFLSVVQHSQLSRLRILRYAKHGCKLKKTTPTATVKEKKEEIDEWNKRNDNDEMAKVTQFHCLRLDATRP